MSEKAKRLAARLRQLANAVTKREMSEFTLRIPADPERDADLVLSTAAGYIERMGLERDDSAIDTDPDQIKRLLMHGDGVLADLTHELNQLVRDGVISHDVRQALIYNIIRARNTFHSLEEWLFPEEEG